MIEGLEIRHLAHPSCILWFNNPDGQVVVEQLDEGETLFLWNLVGTFPTQQEWWRIKEDHFPAAKRVRFERIKGGAIRLAELKL